MDVAIILGPGNPPTLAVISWQWLTQGDADQQTKGALASLLLMLLLAAYVLLGYLLWRGWRRTIPRVDGVRKPATPLLPGNTLASFLPLTGVLCVVLLAILADQSTINSEALINSLTMGLVAAFIAWLVAAFIALLLLLLWLEGGATASPVGATASPVVAMVAHFITRSAAGGGPVHAGAMAEPGWKLDGGGLGASAVGNAVDAVYPATRLAAH